MFRVRLYKPGSFFPQFKLLLALSKLLMYKILLVVVLSFGVVSSNHAEVLFSNGFENRTVPSQFPLVDGSYQLPANPVTDQLNWLMAQFSNGGTSLSAVNSHFNLSAFGLSAEQMRDFIASIRSDFPNAVITDVIMVTPIRLTVLIANPLDKSKFGFLNLGSEFTGQKRINFFSVGNFFGSVQYFKDQSLTMVQAANRFQTLAAETSLLVAKIDNAGVCKPIANRNGSILRATGSIFKIWILAAAAKAWEMGQVSLDQEIALVASELALAGVINGEPLGTKFSLLEIATLMLGISDNTATDLLHQTIGRSLMFQVINGLNLTNPKKLTPLLSVNEQFHLFFSFPLATALSYINGTEAFQQSFLKNQIEPLGPLTSFPHNNDSIFVEGSWRASPMDICKTFSHFRNLPEGSDQLKLIDTALGAGAAQPNIRNLWDRVWYKGGSLESGVTGYHVLTHAWLLENQGSDPYVVIAMANDSNGGIDVFDVQSITGRILELVSQL